MMGAGMNSEEFSGTLWQRVRLERAQETTDSYGGKNRIWVAIDTRWAAVASLPMAEINYAGRVATLNRYQITLRYAADIDVRWRVVWNAKKLSILSLDRPPDKLDRLVLITQQEREQ